MKIAHFLKYYGIIGGVGTVPFLTKSRDARRYTCQL
jgi:hypothetical protein